MKVAIFIGFSSVFSFILISNTLYKFGFINLEYDSGETILFVLTIIMILGIVITLILIKIFKWKNYVSPIIYWPLIFSYLILSFKETGFTLVIYLLLAIIIGVMFGKLVLKQSQKKKIKNKQ